MTVLIIAEHDNQALKPATLNTITAGLQLADTVRVLVMGDECQSVVEQTAKIKGVAEVLLMQDAKLLHPLAETCAVCILSQLEGVTHLLAPATTFGKNILPRVAAKQDVMQLSDIIAINDANTFVRPIYAGNALQTVKTNNVFIPITVRTTAFAPAVVGDNSAAINTIAVPDLPTHSEFVSQELTKTERPELTAADIVVSGGRGVGSGENFALIEELADVLGAAVGASRAAVDAGFVPNDYQVGQTGKVVAPTLYIAIGISGAIQHIAGMKDAKVIVAINNDEEAPIFGVADYGLVGDLFKIVPELITQLKARS